MRSPALPVALLLITDSFAVGGDARNAVASMDKVTVPRRGSGGPGGDPIRSHFGRAGGFLHAPLGSGDADQFGQWIGVWLRQMQ